MDIQDKVHEYAHLIFLDKCNKCKIERDCLKIYEGLCIECYCNNNYKLFPKYRLECVKQFYEKVYELACKVVGKYIEQKSRIKCICKNGHDCDAVPVNIKKIFNICKKCPKIDPETSKQNFIEKATKIHGYKYDYSEVKYINNHTLVTIGCKEHGLFNQIPNSHLGKTIIHGCPKCGKESGANKQRKTIRQFIKEAKIIHGDKYDYSKVDYRDSHAHVTIGCKEHGDFNQQAYHHLSGNGCIKCGIINNSNKLRKPLEQFIEEAKDIHGDIYDYSKVEYISTGKHIIIICKEHGHFNQKPVKHLSGQGCIECGFISSSDKRRKTLEQFIKEAKDIHRDIYDYSKVVYISTHEDVIIECKYHGEFNQEPASHLSGNGCVECGVISSSDKRRKTLEKFIKEATDIHGDTYDYSKVVYISTHEHVTIGCKEHGDFNQTPHIHLRDSGCPLCGIENGSNKRRKTLEQFIKEATDIHGDTYDYSKVIYISTDEHVTIGCKEHGDFNQTPHSHLRDSECSKCPKCKLCPSCELFRTNGKLCEYCLPQEKNKLYQKTKEYKIVKYLKDKLPSEDFIHNKSVGTECTLGDKIKSNGHLFPDIRFDCGSYQLIVEVDENKHRGVNYKCDKQRMYDIMAKLGQPCIFIRYNPDSKESNPEKLLQVIRLYLNNNTENNTPWNEYGFFDTYLFY
jgi:hypothetical protein